MARLEEIRSRLDHLTEDILTILAERNILVREVARNKRENGKPIHAPLREVNIFSKIDVGSRRLGLNIDFINTVFSLLITHAKDAECDEIGLDTFMDRTPQSEDALRADLLRLTKDAAESYATEYCQGAGTDALGWYLQRERDELLRAIRVTKPRGLAIDLGCATGNAADILQRHFDRVVGYDISPHMINRARDSRHWGDHVSFEVHDLDQGIPQADQSVSFLVANFGSASEVSENLLSEVARVLEPGGRAILSYNNRDALSNFWYYPWPATVRAHANYFNNTLEVWFGKNVYVVRNRTIRANELREQTRASGLIDESVWSFPTVLTLLPKFFFDSTRAEYTELMKHVREIDDVLAYGAHKGTYLVTVLYKPSN